MQSCVSPWVFEYWNIFSQDYDPHLLMAQTEGDSLCWCVSTNQYMADVFTYILPPKLLKCPQVDQPHWVSGILPRKLTYPLKNVGWDKPFFLKSSLFRWHVFFWGGTPLKTNMTLENLMNISMFNIGNTSSFMVEFPASHATTYYFGVIGFLIISKTTLSQSLKPKKNPDMS